jgi:hypothetical protein
MAKLHWSPPTTWRQSESNELETCTQTAKLDIFPLENEIRTFCF